MKMGGVAAVVAILVCFYMATSASAEGEQGSAQTDVSGARKDLAEVYTTLVRGMVLCDKCYVGRIYPTFVYLMKDAKVSVRCKDAKGKVTKYGQASTNILGNFEVTLKGRVELKRCVAYLSGTTDPRCNIAGSGRALILRYELPQRAVYGVDPMFYKPAKAIGVCPGKRLAVRIPFANRPPSTCSWLDWLNPTLMCYWPKDLNPKKTTVGSVFGKLAQRKYGSITLEAGLLIPGDLLLKQAITALLNARTNLHFYMSPRVVKAKFNKALQGSLSVRNTQGIAFWMLNIKGKCLLVTCKQ